MEKQHRNVLVLSSAQATLQTSTVLLISVTGLAGFALAENKSLATVPLTCYVLGSAIAVAPASLLMGAIGRRAGFQCGSAAGIVGGLVCALAIWQMSFWLLCAGMMIMGVNTAFGKYYRLAAADVAIGSFKAKAISLTLAGGIAGGVIGPEIAKYTHDLIDNHLYLASYAALSLVALTAMLIMTQLDIPKLTKEEKKGPARPIGEIMRQPEFMVAALVAMMSYGIMNLMMTSTPLAMHAHHHTFRDSVLVIEWHVIGMYAPSFFTGSLINRFGVLKVMLAGVAVYIVSVAAALGGTEVANFWWGMFLCGIGWNFMFVGASTLLTDCHTPTERAKTQAANDFLIFATMAISSSSSGLLLQKSGWNAVNWGALPFLLLAGTATIWLMWRRRSMTVRGTS